MIEIRNLSHSSINLYLTCARAWKFRYVDKIPTPRAAALAFGSAFHNAVEEYIRQKARGIGNSFPVDEMFANLWNADEEEIEYGEKESRESLLELGTGMLDSEVEITGDGPKRKKRNASVFLNDLVPMMDGEEPIIERRIEFTAPGVPVPIIGYIDMIANDGVPVDFKTAARAWYAAKAHDELQPNYYLIAGMKDGLNPKLKFRYIVFTKSAKSPKIQIVETKRTLNQLFWTLDMIKEVWDGIEAEVFPPTGPGSWKCSEKYCEFWNQCRGKA